MTLTEVHVKWSLILMNHSGPEIFSTLWMENPWRDKKNAFALFPIPPSTKYNLQWVILQYLLSHSK